MTFGRIGPNKPQTQYKGLVGGKLGGVSGDGRWLSRDDAYTVFELCVAERLKKGYQPA